MGSAPRVLLSANIFSAHDQPYFGGVASLNIRQYQDSDREAVWEFHNIALTAVGAHAGNGPWDDDFQRVEEVYLGNGGDFLVGEYDDKLVAMGALKRTTDGLAEIKRVRVQEPMHPDMHHHEMTLLRPADVMRMEAHDYWTGYTVRSRAECCQGVEPVLSS